MTDVRLPTLDGDDHIPTHFVAGLTASNVAAASVDGVAGTASMRTLGTGAQQAAAGNHGHAIGDVTGLQGALDGKQASDADLTAIAGLSTTGLISRTGAGTAATVAIGTGAGDVAAGTAPAAAVSAHLEATDPHADRAYAAALVDDLSGVSDAAAARANLALPDNFLAMDLAASGVQAYVTASRGDEILHRHRCRLRSGSLAAGATGTYSFKAFQPAIGSYTLTPLYWVYFTARKNTAGTFQAAQVPFFVGSASTASAKIGSLTNLIGTSFSLTAGSDYLVALSVDSTGANLTVTITNNTAETVGLYATLEAYRPQWETSSTAAASSEQYVWWGDSLTRGGASTAPGGLAAATGIQVINMGIPGDTSSGIAARAMGIRTWISSQVTIPASGAVTIAMNIMSTNVNYQTQRVKIAGISGTLTVSGGNLRFTRTVAGPIVVAPVGTPVYYMDADPATSMIEIVWAGTNDSFSDIATTIANIMTIVRRNRRNQVLVIAPLIASTYPLGTPEHTAYTDALALMSSTFGTTYFDVHNYLITDALADAGITPTAQDITDIANDVTPTSLRSDTLHLTATGYTTVGTKVAAVLTALGWTY